MKYSVMINDHRFAVDVVERADHLQLSIDGKHVEADWEWLTRDRDMSLLLDGRSYNLIIEPENGQLQIYYGGERFDCLVEDTRLAELRRLAGAADNGGGEAKIKAPMPGLILRKFVTAGQKVAKGDRLLIIEAMKMENEVKAPRDGVVKSINCDEQEAVDQGKILLVLA